MNWKKRYRKLEERVLLDAVGAVTVDDAQNTAAQEQARAEVEKEQAELAGLVGALGETQENPETGEGEQTGAEILFVDSQVEDADALLANLADGVEVYFIGPDEDGAAFIADVLANSNKTYDALHIISHGDCGELRLGNTTLNQDSLSGDTLENVAAWGDSLSADGDILIYGCSVAEGEQGIAFVEQLAEITGADIAASVDDTGAAALGGDWDLEVSCGSVEADMAISETSQRAWGNLLAMSVTDSTTLSSQEIADQISGSAGGIGGIKNIAFTGDPIALGTFESLQYGASQTVLMESGIVLTTGTVNNTVAPNETGSTQVSFNNTSTSQDDLDLERSAAAAGLPGNFPDDQAGSRVDSGANGGTGATGDQFDVASFSFDFNANVDKLALGFVFSTEEDYNFAINQDFTDLFGIYLIDNQDGEVYEIAFSNLRALHQQADPDMVLNSNEGFDIASLGNVEMNFITSYSDKVIDLNTLDTAWSAGNSYTVKFAVADQKDQSLDSAAFFDYFGSSIRFDADKDDSSGATGFDFNTGFDASLATPSPVKIVDTTDVTLTNYANDVTSITKVYVELENPSGSDELTIDTSGLSNISVASNTGTSIELDWTGILLDANNEAEILAALKAIEYSNADGEFTNPDDRTIKIYVEDNSGTQSTEAITTIDILRVLDVPTVESQVTDSTTPTLSGTFDGINSDLLRVEVGGATYEVTDFGNLPTGWTISGDDWSLDLSTATPTSGSSPSLVPGSPYNVVVYNENADADETDGTSGELTITDGLSVTAADDTLTVTEDEGSPSTESGDTVAGGNLLDNDFVPSPPQTPIYDTNLILEYVAGDDSDGNTTWEDQQPGGGGTDNVNWNWSQGVTRVTGITSTTAPQIDTAYQFDGASDAAISGNVNEYWTERSATWEFWLKVDDITGLSTDTDYVIIDAGRGGAGFTLAYHLDSSDLVANPNGEFRIYYNDQGGNLSQVTSLKLGDDAADNPSADFMQIAVSFDDANDQILWHRNGVAEVGTDIVKAGTEVRDWARQDSAASHWGLGSQVGNLAGAGGSVNFENPASFEGQIASVRMYGYLDSSGADAANTSPVFANQAVADNYANLTYQPASGSVTNVEGNTIPDGGSNTATGTIIGSGGSGGTFTVNSDGTWDYDSGTAFQYLGIGETAQDQVTYTIDDGLGNTATANITVTVTGVDDAPEAPSASVNVGVNATDVAILDSEITIDGGGFSLDADDADGDLIITILQVPGPGHGIVTLSGTSTPLTAGQTLTVLQLKNLQYDAPGGSYDGLAIDDFIYEVDDGTNLPVEGTVSFDITGFIPPPGVDAQTTIEKSPEITGTFNGNLAESLKVTIPIAGGGPDLEYEVTDIQTIDPQGNDDILIIDKANGTWSIDLAGILPTAPELDEGTYDILVEQSGNGAADVADLTSGELIVDYIDEPIADDLTTINQQPVLTGTFDEANGATLTLLIDGTTDYGPYTVNSDTGFTSDGNGNWTLDLAAAGITVDEDTYTLTPTSTGGGNTFAGAGTLIVNTSLFETAENDALIVIEDSTAAENTVPADGLLTNDFNFVGSVDSDLESENVAADDLGNNVLWVDPFTAQNWQFSSAQDKIAADSNFPGITESYYFNGGLTADSTVDYSDAETEQDRSFEFWIKPDPDNITDGQEYLFFEAGGRETSGGGTNGGFNLTYTYSSSGADTVSLNFENDDGNLTEGTPRNLSVDLPAGVDPTKEFIQVTAVFNTGTGNIDLVVGAIAESTREWVEVTDQSDAPVSSMDWSGTNNMTLGGLPATSDDVGGSNEPANSFVGEIAIVRIYDGALSFGTATSEVGNNFGAVADHFRVTDVSSTADSGTITQLPAGDLAAPGFIEVEGNNGGKFIVFSDGSYSYDPNGYTPGLFDALNVGDTATDQIDYTVEDVFNNTSSATLTVIIEGVNDAPVAADGEVCVSIDDSATAIGLVAPFPGATSPGGEFDKDNTDPGEGGDEILITITQAPDPSNNEGKIVKSGTNTALTNGQTLTAAELLALEYIAPTSPYSGDGEIPDFTYTIDDGDASPVEGVVELNIVGFVAEPTVDSQTTYNTEPTITGTFDGTVVEVLQVTVNGKTYESNGLQSAPSTLSEISVDLGAGTWSLDLSTVLTDAELEGGQTYDVSVFVQDDNGLTPPAGTATDSTASELVITELGTPTVVPQVTATETPIITGTYDEAGTETLIFSIFTNGPFDGEGSFLGTFTLGQNGFTNIGTDTWQIDWNALDVPPPLSGSPTATDYHITITAQGGGQDKDNSGVQTVELTVDTVNVVVASPDVGSVDADDTLTVSAEGILGNDVGLPGTSSYDLISRFNPSEDTAPNTIYEDEEGTSVEYAFGFGQNPNSNPKTNYPGIDSAKSYNIAGGADGTDDYADYTGGPDSDLTDEATTFEFWFQADGGSVSNGTEYIIYESGSNSNGFTLTYTPEVGNDQLTLYFVGDGGDEGQVTYDIGSLDPTAEFIQVAVVLDPAGNQIALHVNGGDSGGDPMLAVGGKTGTDTVNFSNWSDGDNPGLGTTTGTLGGGDHSLLGSPSNFLGEYSIIRVHDSALSAGTPGDSSASVAGAFMQVANHLYVSGANGDTGGGTGTSNTMTEPDAGDPANSISITTDAGGSVTVFSDGSYTYDPSGAFDSLGAGDSDTDAFIYTVTDVLGETATATVTITVNGVNDAPTAADKTLNTNEDVALTFVAGDFSFNDPDTGDTLASIEIQGAPSAGTLTYDGNPIGGYPFVVAAADISKLLFTPAENANGAGYATFDFTVSDGSLESLVANTITIDVDAVADAPVIDLDGDDSSGSLLNDYSATFTEGDSPISIGDTDVTITDADDTNLEGATITLTNSQDGDALAAGSLPAGITVDLVQSNSSKIVLTGSASLADYETAIKAITFDNTLSNPDEVDRTITVVVDDGDGDSSGTLATATISVVDVNNPPTAADNTLTTDEDDPLTFVAGDFGFSDVDIGDSLVSIEIQAAPSAGTLTYDSNPIGGYPFIVAVADINKLLFTPAENANGAGYANFDFTVNDGTTDSVSANTITIDVNPENDLPVAQAELVGTNEETVLNDSVPAASDVDGTIDANGYALVANVAEGSLTFNNDGSYSFDPGSDFDDLAAGATRDVTFTYTASDNLGGVSAPATITITVTGTNDLPVAQAELVGTNEETVLNDSVPAASDVDGTIDANGYALVANVAEGSLTFNNDGSYSFDPGSDFDDLAAGATRDVTFTYTASDNLGGVSAPATITITVTGTNDLPVAQAELVGTNEETVLNDSVPAASDVDGTIDANGYALVANVAEGSLTFNNDGSYSFDPGSDFDDLAAGATRDVTFTYTASDNLGGVSAPATITITVTGTNDLPDAVDDVASTSEDTPVTIDVLSNDSDSDGGTLSVTSASAVSGSVSVNGDGTLSYTPNADFNGTDTITYVISDGQGGSDTASVTVTVNAVDDGAATPNPIAKSTGEDTPLVESSLGVTDADGIDGTGAYQQGTGPTNGVISGFNPNTGGYTYTPNAGFSGSDSFTVVVTDSDGFETTVTVNVTVSGDPAIQTPSTGTTATVFIDEGDTSVTTVTATDPDNAAADLTYSISGGSDETAFGIDPATGALTLNSAADFESQTSYQVEVTVTDPDGNTDSQLITVFVNDADENAPSITSPSSVSVEENFGAGNPVLALEANDDVSTGGDITFAITGGADQAAFNIDGTDNIVFVANPDYELPADSNADNSYEIVVTATDEAGNTATQTITINVTDLDEVAPVQPNVDLVVSSDSGVLSADDLTFDSTPTIRVGWTAPGDASDPVVGDTVVLYANASQVGSVVLTATDISNGFVEITSTDLATDGLYSFTASIEDDAGNTSPLSTSLDVTIDTEAPTVLGFAATVPSGTYGVGDTITADATMSEAVAAGTSFTVTLSNGSEVTFTAPADGTVMTASYTITAADASDPNLRIVGYDGGDVIDLAGNALQPVTGTSTISAGAPIVVDTTGPIQPEVDLVSTSDTGISDTDDITADDTPTFRVTWVAPGDERDPQVGDTVSISVDGGAPTAVVLDATDITNGYVEYTPVVALPDGDYTITAQITDNEGNASLVSDDLDVLIDTLNPTVAPTVDSMGPTSDTTPEITGSVTLDIGEVLEVEVNGVVYRTTDSSASLVVTGNTWTLQIPNDDALVENTYEVTATVRDLAGNFTVDSTSDELTIDLTPPDQPTVDPQPVLSPTATPIISGTVGVLETEDVMTVTVSDGTATRIYEEGVDTELFVDGAGGWTLTIPGEDALPDGEYDVTVSVTDEAGNTAIDPTSQELLVDSTAPLFADQTMTFVEGRPASSVFAQIELNDVAGITDFAIKWPDGTLDSVDELSLITIDRDGNISFTAQGALSDWNDFGVGDDSRTVVIMATDAFGRTAEANITLAVTPAAVVLPPAPAPVEPEPEPVTEPEPEPVTEPEPEPVTEPEPEPVTEPEPEPVTEPEPEPEPVEPVPEPEPEPTPAPSPAPVTPTVPQPDPSPAPEPGPEPAPSPEPSTEIPPTVIDPETLVPDAPDSPASGPDGQDGFIGGGGQDQRDGGGDGGVLSNIGDAVDAIEDTADILWNIVDDRLRLGANLEDQPVVADGETQLTLPEDTFTHDDPFAQIEIEATMADGGALPAYVEYDQDSQTFIVDGEAASAAGVKEISVQLVGTADDGETASGTFTIEVLEGAEEAVAEETAPAAEGNEGISGEDSTAAEDASGFAGAGQLDEASGDTAAAPPTEAAPAPEAEASEPAALEEQAIRLAVTLDDQRVLTEGVSTIALPTNTFEHTDPQEIILIEATQADGSPLPQYVDFDPETMTFEVDGPEAAAAGKAQVEVLLVGEDRAGNSASGYFVIVLEDAEERVEPGIVETAPAQQGEADPDSPENAEAQVEDGVPVETEEQEAAADEQDDSETAQAAPEGKENLDVQLQQASRYNLVDRIEQLLEDIRNLFT